MSTMKINKLQTMERCRRNIFLPMSTQYTLRVVALGLFLSCPNWLPIICSYLKLCFLVSLPNISTIVLGPKCLFVISNIIIIFLVGESRLSGQSPQPDVYEEYVQQRQSLQKVDCGEVKGKESALEEPWVGETREKDEEVEREGEEECGGEEGVEREYESDEKCKEEKGLPAEELKRRVEDFVARVNMQRKLEARMLLCYG